VLQGGYPARGDAAQCALSDTAAFQLFGSAQAMGHRIAVMHDGVLQQIDTPQAIAMRVRGMEHTGRETLVFFANEELPDLAMAAGSEFAALPGDVVSVKLRMDAIRFMAG